MQIIMNPDVDLETRQDSAFYTWPGTTGIAVVEHGGRKVYVDCVGEMYLSVPEIPAHLDVADDEVYRQDWPHIVVRYADQLSEIGVHTDADLENLDKRFSQNGYEIWHMNSWFEVWSDEDDFGYDTFHSVSEAIDAAVQYIQDEEYWKALDIPAQI